MNIKWNYTDGIVNGLLAIESARKTVSILQLPISIEEELKKENLVKRTHYSTKIEGNTLKLSQVKDLIEKEEEVHERNEREVKNYYNALLHLNKKAEKNEVITKKFILELHNIVVGENISNSNSFRDGQNSVNDSVNGRIVYLPPEAKDVEKLIDEMLLDLYKPDSDIPIPIRAGIFAYQFVTIHPFWDGNGRCSRLLATYILKMNGYDLNGFFTLEEFYDRNIKEYYDSLQMDLNHNYYFGRNNADITTWIEYFIKTMSSTFKEVESKINELYNLSHQNLNLLDSLDARERWIANYIINNKTIRAKDIREHFKINLDTANNWIKKWIKSDLLERVDYTQKRNKEYTLTEKYRFEWLRKEIEKI